MPTGAAVSRRCSARMARASTWLACSGGRQSPRSRTSTTSTAWSRRERARNTLRRWIARWPGTAGHGRALVLPSDRRRPGGAVPARPRGLHRRRELREQLQPGAPVTPRVRVRADPARNGLPVIRTPRKTDQGYIASPWAKSILRGTHAWERHGTARTGHQIHSLIDQVLDRQDTRALVRVKPGDPDVILGWVLYVEGPGVPIVHY